MTFFGLSMTKKNYARIEGEENIGEFPVTWVVGGRAMRISLVRTRVCARRCALTEPERGIGL